MKKILIIAGIFFAFLITSFALQSAGVQAVPNLWTWHISFFGQSIRVVDFLIASIIISISIMLILLVFMLLNRAKMERREKIKQDLLVKYQSLILNYLQDKTDSHFNTLKKLSFSKFRRQLLIDQICDLCLNASPSNALILKELYFKLKLHKVTYRKLHSGHWHKKIKAFKELYAMNITDKNKVIYKYINSKNDILRMEAQIALVDLSKETDSNPFEFLSKLSHPFSLWEQITLHQIMVQRDLKVPDFGQWLLSDNHTVKMFCLRMIREYKQVNNKAAIKLMTFNDNPDVRKLAYEVLGDLKLKGAISEVKCNYKSEPRDIQLTILKSLVKCPDESLLYFLQDIIDKTDDADIQIEAVKAIHNMENGDKLLKDMQDSQFKDYNIIIKHVLDHRIN